jgi:hypothetical protein
VSESERERHFPKLPKLKKKTRIAADESLDIEYSSSVDAWSAFIKKVNDSINSLDLEIVTLHDETSGKPMHALVRDFFFFVLRFECTCVCVCVCAITGTEVGFWKFFQGEP